MMEDPSLQHFPSLKRLLDPASVAVIGATEDPGYGQRAVSNLKTMGFQGEIFPVNPRRESVFGMKCYPDVLSIPSAVDLAVVVVPARAVPDVLRQCVKAKVGAAVVISNGFAERGDAEGRSLQEEIVDICREGALPLCGPNCIGIANVSANCWATAISGLSPGLLRNGPLALIAQSGATAFGPLLYRASDLGIGIKYVVSVGNEAVLQAADYVAYMIQDPEIKGIMLFLEAIRDPRRFSAAASAALAAGKPLVVMKIGRSEQGSRAALTHTAALTGEDRIYDAYFRQKAILRVDDYDELCEIAWFMARTPEPPVEGIGVISHSGGIGALVADKMGELGLNVPALQPETIGSLKSILAGAGSAGNPADVTWHARREHFGMLLDAFSSAPQIGTVVVATHGPKAQADIIGQFARRSGKAVTVVWTGSVREKEVLESLQSTVPVFSLPGTCARALWHRLRYSARRKLIANVSKEHDIPDRHLPYCENAMRVLEAFRGKKRLTEVEAKQFLKASGVPVPRGRLCTTVEEAMEAADEIGFPVAMKLISRYMLHKTDVGGVKLNVASEADLREAWQELQALRMQVTPRLAEQETEAILVEEMVVGGLETIIGAQTDPFFGPVLVLGIGGVLAEAVRLVGYGICPIRAELGEVAEVFAQVPALERLLAGYRGMPARDRRAAEEVVERLSWVLWACREMVESMDINPLAVLEGGRGAVALDAVLVMR